MYMNFMCDTTINLKFMRLKNSNDTHFMLFIEFTLVDINIRKLQVS